MINSCWSWLRAEVSHKPGQIKGLHPQPIVAVLTVWGSSQVITTSALYCVSCGVCCQLGDLDPSWNKTIIYGLIRLDCNSQRWHLRNPYYHNILSTQLPFLAFHSGFLIMTVSLGHKFKVFREWDQIYLKELKKLQKEDCSRSFSTQAKQTLCHRAELLQADDIASQGTGSVIQSLRMWGTAWTSCSKPATLPQVSSSVHKQLKAKDTSKQAFSWKTRGTSWSC